MPLAFFTWQRPRRSHARGQYASLSRISLLWKNRSAKIDPATVAQTEDKKQGQQREKEKQEDKEQANPSKDKDPTKEKPGSKETGDKANNDEQENGDNKEEKREDKQKKPGTLGNLLKDPNPVEAEKPDKPPVARIVAYSDSEGEDEPFRLTRRKKKKTDDSDQNAETEEEKDVEPSGVVAQLPQAIQQTPKLLKAARVGARRGATRGVTKLRREAGLGLVLQCLLLWLFRRWKRKESHRLELLTLAISLPDALACAADKAYPSSRLPGRLSTVYQFLESWARPAAAFQLVRLVRRLGRKRKRPRQRIRTTISQSARLFEEAEQKGTTTPGKFRRALPRLATEIASSYEIELTEMRRILEEEHHCRLPSDRFDATNAELLRFAASAGLLEAASPEEKAHAVQEGAKRVLKTLEWNKKRRFMSNAQLKEWHHLVRWQGTNSEGWPILVIKVALACAQTQAEKADEIADVIISQMHRALTEVFSNERGPDKLVVILDASSAYHLQAARHVTTFKETAVCLNKHFPFRLEKLFIVDLPSQLRWVLATLRHMLHPDTKQKIHLVSINDPALPLQPHLLQTPQEQALIAEGQANNERMDRSRRVSIPELPVSRTPPMPLVRPLTHLFDHKIAEEDEDAVSELEKQPSPPKRRVRIMELPFREFEPKQNRTSFEKSSQAPSPTTGIMRPALKRSTSVGVLGLEVPRRSEDSRRD